MTDSLPPNFKLVQSAAVPRLFALIRPSSVNQRDFVKYSNRIMRLLVEEGLAHLPHKTAKVETPCGVLDAPALSTPIVGKSADAESSLCAVSIVRSGNVMVEAVREIVPDISVGHVLVQRDESDPEKKPKFYYKKFPPDVKSRNVILCDPMLATGGSAKAAIKCLVDEGVPEENILFINLICAPEGLVAMYEAYPKVLIVTAIVDDGLNDDKFIVPGLGDFGDRYYNTQ